MNRRLRVLLIGRRFWPHGSIDSARFLFQLACAMHRQDIHVEVVSPRYASSWPTEFAIREIPVHRPAAAPRSDWSMGRYARHLTTWLRQHAGSFDVLLVDAIREEATAAIEASRSLGCPTIVRCGGWGVHSDLQWWQTSRSARKCGMIGKMADAVIANSADAQRALIADGYAASRIERIDHGFATGSMHSATRRRIARKVLGQANSDLIAHEDSPVVLCASRMTRESGATLLVKAARHLVAKCPDLRIWFLGDGPHRDAIYEQLRGDGVRASIAMPGSFCGDEELFAAADVFLQADEDGLDFFLPTAIAHEVPVVAVDTASTRAIIGKETEIDGLVEWLPGATSKMTRLGILRVLEDLSVRRSKASDLRRILLRGRPQSDAIQAYVRLVDRLVQRRAAAGRGSSVEAAS